MNRELERSNLQTSNYSPSVSPYNTNKQHKSKKPFWIIIILVLTAVIAIGSFLFWQNSKGSGIRFFSKNNTDKISANNGDNYSTENQNLENNYFQKERDEEKKEERTIYTGCLEFPVKKGNTWKYKVTNTQSLIPGEEEVTSSLALSEITNIDNHEVEIKTETIEGEGLNSLKQIYGFDKYGNMYFNYFHAGVLDDEGKEIIRGGIDARYINYRFFSCTDDYWKTDYEITESSGNDKIEKLGFSPITRVTGIATIERNVKINVPAGEFEAMLVTHETDADIAQDSISASVIDTNLKYWFVPGIGIVKHETISFMGHVKSVYELTEYNLR